jgi:glycosyltransferase involved in cell wall biosynthesis
MQKRADVRKAAESSTFSATAPKGPKVLHVIESLAPAGAEQVLVNTVPALSKLGVAGDVAVLWPPYDLARPLREQSILVHELNIRSTWSIRTGVSGLRRVIVEGGYDLIHAHLPMAVFYSATARGRVPVIASFHGLSFEHYPASTLPKKLRRMAERWWTNHRVNAYIAVSSAVAEHYENVLHVPRSNIAIIPNGFPVDRLVRDPTLDVGLVRSGYGLSPLDFVLLHVGRFVTQKGHMHLMQAAQALRERGIRFKILLIGQGPKRDDVMAFIGQHQLGEIVQVHPPVAHAELLKVLQASDAFVFPSVSEGFGMAAGEAMCLGLPVIASNLQGIASLIEDGVSGALVPPADSAALAGAIERMIANPQERERMSAAARKRIEDNFAIEKIASRIIDVYRGLVPAG